MGPSCCLLSVSSAGWPSSNSFSIGPVRPLSPPDGSHLSSAVPQDEGLSSPVLCRSRRRVGLRHPTRLPRTSAPVCRCNHRRLHRPRVPVPAGTRRPGPLGGRTFQTPGAERPPTQRPRARRALHRRDLLAAWHLQTAASDPRAPSARRPAAPRPHAEHVPGNSLSQRPNRPGVSSDEPSAGDCVPSPPVPAESGEIAAWEPFTAPTGTVLCVPCPVSAWVPAHGCSSDKASFCIVPSGLPSQDRAAAMRRPRACGASARSLPRPCCRTFLASGRCRPPSRHAPHRSLRNGAVTSRTVPQLQRGQPPQPLDAMEPRPLVTADLTRCHHRLLPVVLALCSLTTPRQARGGRRARTSRRTTSPAASRRPFLVRRSPGGGG